MEEILYENKYTVVSYTSVTDCYTFYDKEACESAVLSKGEVEEVLDSLLEHFGLCL